MNELQEVFERAIAMGAPPEVFQEVERRMQQELEHTQAKLAALPGWRLLKRSRLSARANAYSEAIDQAKIAASKATPIAPPPGPILA